MLREMLAVIFVRVWTNLPLIFYMLEDLFHRAGLGCCKIPVDTNDTQGKSVYIPFFFSKNSCLSRNYMFQQSVIKQ